MTQKLHFSLRRFVREKKGSTAITMAILTPIIIAGLAFGAEYSYFEHQKRRLQNAADSAAFAAATQLRSGLTTTEMRTAALTIAEESGYDNSAVGASLTLTSPPTSGAYAGDVGAVHVALSQTVDRKFSALYNSRGLVMPVEAVAQVRNGRPACVLALAPAAPEAIDVQGSTDVTLTGCDIAANSIASDALSMQGTAKLETDCISTVGTSVTTGNLTLNDCPEPIENAPVTPDPYKDRPEPPAATTSCQSNNNDWTKSNGKPKTGNKYCAASGTIAINDTITVQKTGGYDWVILSGGTWKFNATSVFEAIGVTLFLTDGAVLDINGGADFTLKAPTSGDYSGLAVYIDDDDTSSHKLNGGSDFSIVGAVYGAQAHIEFTGNTTGSGPGECTQVIGYTVKFSGNSDFDTDCTASGTTEIRVAKSIRVVE